MAYNFMNILSGKKSYIISGVIALIGFLAAANIIQVEAAQEIIVILIGFLGAALRHGVAKIEKQAS